MLHIKPVIRNARLSAILAHRAFLDELMADPSNGADSRLVTAIDFAAGMGRLQEQLQLKSMSRLHSGHVARCGPAAPIEQLAGELYEAWELQQRLVHVRESAPRHAGLAVRAASLARRADDLWTELFFVLTSIPSEIRARDQLDRIIESAPRSCIELTHWLKKLEVALCAIHVFTDADSLAIPRIETIPLDDFLRDAVAMVAAGPIKRLPLSGAGGRVDELARCPQLAEVEQLYLLSQGVTDGDMVALAESPYVRNLCGLNVEGNLIGEIGLDAVAAASSTTMRSLGLFILKRNVVPDPADTFDFVDEFNRASFPTPRGIALERHYGPLRWLHPWL